ncbi:lycopene cyclase domain-containing protein [Corallococcus sp. ZKHCc1 1396]|uniref:Lycopene cyclase domain-containing protein n=1 Tax=Corallococcus soli TaxID=2710757 RepID=A0ABR9PH14_9BACT|nr:MULTISPECIES: lycopene cyclase domain-containing protein [Corallococcus]MBE4747197.1 lycopene cyclase domain-containing protein [Corallococcus soli]MCY1036532.1 lycopene cyclase domain-containing protein [Corallococcus sp. BB11-1]
MMETRWAYLIHLLAWTLPVIGIQLALLVSHYKSRSGEVLRAVMPPALVVGVYLSIADHLAISTGIWNFGPGRHVGVYLGVVPLEEVLFFLITSVLVSLGLALFTALFRLREARPS